MATKTKTEKTKKAKAGGKGAAEREVVYPDLDVLKYVGDSSMDPETAKDFMGWQTETQYLIEKHGEDATEEVLRKSEHKWGDDYYFLDDEGNKCRALNNIHNRPITDSWAYQLAYEILNGRWKLNGETVVIGKTKSVRSGQHRLVALIIAEQLWARDKHWKKLWPDGPRIETLVAVGVDEDEDTTRTLDNVKPRSLSDVIFTDPTMFAGKSAHERKQLARSVDFCIRLLWERTNAKVANPHGPYMSHPAAMQFLARHNTIKKACLHIVEEDGEQKISQFISQGYAAALLYLFGSSDSQREKYEESDPRGERKLNWDNWDKAEEFWVAFSTKQFDDVRKRISESDGSRGAKMAILCKAWNLFKEGKRPTYIKTEPEYEINEHTYKKKLIDAVNVGGIDYGPAYARPKPEEEPVQEDPVEDAVEEEHDDPTPPEQKPVKKRTRKQVNASEEFFGKGNGQETPVEEEVPEEEPVLEETA